MKLMAKEDGDDILGHCGTDEANVSLGIPKILSRQSFELELGKILEGKYCCGTVGECCR